MAQLFVITKGDVQTDYMAENWGGPLASATAAPGASTLLVDPTREQTEAALAGRRIVAFFGHGTPNSLGIPAVIDGENIHRATGVVVAIACRSARNLAPIAIAGGTEAYVGFIDDVPILASDEIDSLVRDGFARLLEGTESPTEFESRFEAACERLQQKFFAIKRDDDAYLLGHNVMVLKLALRVLERTPGASLPVSS